MAVQRMPRAELEPRPGDWPLTNEQILRLSLFSSLKRKPSLERFPGAVAVRTFHAGETICWQGEPGWTAFYVLTTEDVLTLRQEQLLRGHGDRLRLSSDIGHLRRRIAEDGPQEQTAWRIVGTVHVATPRSRSPRDRLLRLARASGRPVPGLPVYGLESGTLYVPVDGPATCSYDTMRGALYEGELFGEASCTYRTPRPGTVVATRDCYVLEILRNILDQLYKEPGFRELADGGHERREAIGWRKLSLLADLTDSQFEAIAGELRLVRAEPGAVVCDEFEPADAVHVVRNGLVRVSRNVSSLVPEDAIRDWPKLLQSLGPKASGPLARLRQLIDGYTPVVVGDQRAILRALNCVLTHANLLDDTALSPLANSIAGTELAASLARRQDAKKRGKAWPDREARRCHRLLIETLFPNVFRPVAEQGGLETTISYCGPGEWFGEEAVLANGTHEATFAAHGHPHDEGMAELVRIPAEVFAWMLDVSPGLRLRVEEEAKRRREEAMRRMLEPVWQDSEPVQASREFEELGLIQGQRLMLIDLDRCTRCNECVKACVASHSDGIARLALDGPRLGKYLVPMTCRSCLDPVCLIGCPVGSIHRGSDRQIVIEDWCIGCGLCAEKCPYGSIQMQDLGVIAESSGWRYAPGETVKEERWKQPGFRDDRWLLGEAPLRYDRTLLEELRSKVSEKPSGVVFFRHAFQLLPSADGVRHRMEITSKGTKLAVFVNGVAAEPEAAPRQGRATYSLEKSGEGPVLRPGVNVIAVSVELPGAVPNGEVLLGARLDEVKRPRVPANVSAEVAEEVTEKQVTNRAVTCDLCSSIPGQGPACVRVCPHEAAMRVEARKEFPPVFAGGRG